MSKSLELVQAILVFLACLCSLLGRRYWFEYMPCFSDYCNQLAQEQVHPTDSFLVELVRVRNLADQANAIFWQLIETHDKTQASAGSMHHIAVSSIRKGLEVYQRQIPLRFKDNQLLQMHCAAVCIRLFEPGAPSGGPATQQPPINRSQLIWDCLQSTRTLYEAFCAVPLDCYPYLTFDTILHLALALIKSSRLLFLTDETWDAQAARSVYKLSDILQHLGKLFEAANDLGHARCVSPSIFVIMSHLKYYAYKDLGVKQRKDFHYSQAVRVGDRIECAGQGGWDPKTGAFEKEINAQIDLAFANVDLALKDAGGKGWSQVFRVNSYHLPLNTEAMDAMVRNFRKYMPDHQPLWTCVGVTRLGEDDMRVEIEVSAHDPEGVKTE
ncbi:hypothetical protein MY3296_000445 [Beauveria thailandica]